MLQAYRFRIYPTDEQKEAIERNFGCARYVYNHYLEKRRDLYEKDGKKVSVSASVGIALAPEHGCTYEELSRKADQALYMVKRNNKKGYCLYQNEK